jgi:hypothetical protein
MAVRDDVRVLLQHHRLTALKASIHKILAAAALGEPAESCAPDDVAALREFAAALPPRAEDLRVDDVGDILALWQIAQLWSHQPVDVRFASLPLT